MEIVLSRRWHLATDGVELEEVYWKWWFTRGGV
jgi:hypothetical protein